MLSNKLTFSLASLIVILAFALIANTAVAAGGPSVTIEKASGTQTRGAFKVDMTFSATMDASTTTASNITIVALDSDNNVLTQANSPSGNQIHNVSAPTVTPATGTVKKFTATFDFATETTHPKVRKVRVLVAGDTVTSTSTYKNTVTDVIGADGNEPAVSMDLTLPAIIADRTVVITAAKDAKDTDLADGMDYTVTFDFDGVIAVSPVPTNSEVLVDPKSLKSAVVGTADPAVDSTDPSQYTLTVTLPPNVVSVGVGLDPGYIASASVSIPPASLNAAPMFDSGLATTITGTVDTAITDVTFNATDADGDTLTYSITPAVPSGLTFAAASGMISGTPTAVHDMAHTINVFDGTDSATHSVTITVKAKPRVVADAMATVTEVGGVTTVSFKLNTPEHIIIANDPIAAGLINATGYRLIDAQNGMHLDDFFRYGGGTIELIGPTGSAAKDIVISEIMWGKNEKPGHANPNEGQWIELFRTTSSTTAGTWSLKFTRRGLASTTNAVDRMSTHPEFAAAWNVTAGDHGQGGHGEYTTNNVRVLSKTFISMNRNINFTDFVNKTKRNEQLDAIKDGTQSANWAPSAAVRGENLTTGSDVYATPGQQGSSAATKTTTKTELTPGDIVINEVGNRTDDSEDWIELRNTSASDVNLDGWVLTVATQKDGKITETIIVDFQGDDDELEIPAGLDASGDPASDNDGYLVLVNTIPSKTELAAGEDLADPRSSPRGVSTTYYQDSDLKIPEKDFLLILRHKDGREKLGEKDNAHENIQDIAAAANFEFTGGKYKTKAWPLHFHGGAAFKVHKDELKANDGKAWVRDLSKGYNHDDTWKEVGYTGLGYDRNAVDSSGSPGYANGNRQKNAFDADDNLMYELTISEIMYQSPEGNRALPQWIELYNNSDTYSVNLDDWQLEILNVDRDRLGGTRLWKIRFEDFTVPPNQTVLLVSTSTSRVSQLDRTRDFFPENRVYDLFDRHAAELDMTNRKDRILNESGFRVVLKNTNTEQKDKDTRWSDMFSNIEEGFEWELPAYEQGSDRSSIIRVYDNGGPTGTGDAKEDWLYAVNLDVLHSDRTYYGDPDDFGTPGWRSGGPLPVSLSSFRPARDKATGEVVIRWITQSELNNAGFNILRSETKTGEFEVVNTKGIIPGHGTTSEKHVYTWTDTTAKPNVVYYYQIEDVSLDGNRTTLRTTHLRGNVNAAGKLTTRWGELKTYGK